MPGDLPAWTGYLASTVHDQPADTHPARRIRYPPLELQLSVRLPQLNAGQTIRILFALAKPPEMAAELAKTTPRRQVDELGSDADTSPSSHPFSLATCCSSAVNIDIGVRQAQVPMNSRQPIRG